MTDSITNAQQISGCEQQTTQGVVHSLQLYYNSEFQEYLECLGNNTTYATGGYNNPSAQATCNSILEKNKKVYCTNKVRNQPPAVQPTTETTGSVDVPNTKNTELLVRQKEANAQKLIADRQSQSLKLKNKAVNDTRNKVINLAVATAFTLLIPKLPISNQRILIALSLAKQIKNLAKERKKNSKSSLSQGKKVYTYPIKPMTPEDTTVSTETPTPSQPTISSLPTASPEPPIPSPPDIIADYGDLGDNEIVSEPVKYFVSQFRRSGGKWGALFELIGSGDQYFPNDPIMLLRIEFSNSEEASREAIIRKITTQGIDGNPPQPDFVWPGR